MFCSRPIVVALLLLLFPSTHPESHSRDTIKTPRQMSQLTNFLNSQKVPYEVREWKIGDYGWVVQPDAGSRPSEGEVRLGCKM